MKIYLVGGAVRDKLLGLKPHEFDWVVVGSTAEEMQALGYQQVGKDFPVFLHPQSHDEYALARTERKTQPGYHGFDVHASPEVTLEQDLIRRDLTINAIAEDQDGQLIDPFDGQQDLEAGLLRHISPAFSEDPVRILRIARFAARFAKWGFRVAHGTHALMCNMVKAGEVDALVAERVWAETFKALAEDNPERFFEVLHACGALARIYPEIDTLFGETQTETHTAGESNIAAIRVLQQACKLSDSKEVRFAALLQNLSRDKSSHDDQHASAIERVRKLCTRIKAPRDFRDLAIICTAHFMDCQRALELDADALLKILKGVDAFRRPQRFEQFLLACTAAINVHATQAQSSCAQAELLRQALASCQSVNTQALLAQGLEGKQLAEALQLERIQSIQALLTST